MLISWAVTFVKPVFYGQLPLLSQRFQGGGTYIYRPKYSPKKAFCFATFQNTNNKYELKLLNFYAHIGCYIIFSSLTETDFNENLFYFDIN